MQPESPNHDRAEGQKPKQTARDQTFWTILLFIGISALIYVVHVIHTWLTQPLGFQ